MRRIFSILTAFATVVFFSASCSKDEQNIVGKWQTTNYAWRAYDGDKLVQEGSESCISWYLGFNFKSDGTGQEVYYTDEEVTTYQLTWVLMGDKLIVTSEDKEATPYDVHELKRNSMALTMTSEDAYDEGKTIITYTFKRVD